MNDPIQPLLTSGADDLSRAGAERLSQARDASATLRALPADASFVDVVEAYDAVSRPIDAVRGLAQLFFQVHPDAEVRSAAAELEQQIARFATEFSLDRDVYDALARLDLAEAPDDVTRRIVEHALRNFRRAGVDRDEATRERVRALREELVTIGQEFSRNIAGDVRSITLPEGVEGLAGLPDDWIAAHPPADDGSVTVTTDPTDYMPFMKYARNREHRAALHRAFASRGAPANLEVLDRMLAKRHELATALGYPTWAAYVTEDKMIKTSERAGEFIERVVALSGTRAEDEIEELLTEVRRDMPDAEFVRDYDRGFYAERVRRERFGFDTKEVRPYFAYDAVAQGVMDTAARLYGIDFVEADVPVWHEDVRVYDLVEDGTVRARLFLDMHPRADKYKHAAMFDVCAGRAGDRVPQACLVCNFPKPTADDPGLMEPRDVVTYFHEFGHLLHHLLAGDQRWLAVSGIATEWDFVEVPSQLFEEWARNVDVLRSFARHHETGEPIPTELVERMRAADDYGKGIQTRFQMFYAALSLEYYSRDPAGLDTTELMIELRERHVPFAPHEEGTAFQAAFGHLDGYTALYYTYMWSLVLAKDIFSVFDGQLMDAETARRYRECILAPGGSKDAEDLVEDFLGRPFAFDAFERWLAA